MESKKEIYDIIPVQYIPRTLFFKKGTDATEVIKAIAEAGIAYPCIAKPDIGCKGKGVDKIDGEEGISRYGQRINMDFLVQELIGYPNEVGIFYCRIPGEENGKITGIVSKEFLIIKGDGVSTIRTLLEKEPRYHFQLAALQKIYGAQLETIPAKGEQRNMVPFGNHARGARFIDKSEWVDERFSRSFDHICKQVPEFYFGRMDVMYKDLEDLKDGKNLSIIELNGAGSEPTHIYDPGHSIFFAWKEIARHLGLLYRVSIKNRERGYRYLTVKEGLQMFRENKALIRNLEKY